MGGLGFMGCLGFIGGLGLIGGLGFRGFRVKGILGLGGFRV